MADTMFVKEAAELWNISERRVSTLCKEGKIQGAEKQGKSWLIPADVEKPADGRVKSGLYKKSARPVNLPLPIGVSDYRLASSEYYYVDKGLHRRTPYGLSLHTPPPLRKDFEYGYASYIL